MPWDGPADRSLDGQTDDRAARGAIDGPRPVRGDGRATLEPVVLRGVLGGAILASLAAEIYPDAYQEAGPYITLATVVGFLGPFLL